MLPVMQSEWRRRLFTSMPSRGARFSAVHADGNDTHIGTVGQAGRARGKGGWGGAQKGAGATPGKQDQTQA